MEGESPIHASTAPGAVFLSYASEDAAAAERIATALRNADVEVWFDKVELRGGDAWDRQIRKQIHDCALFIPIISSHSQGRLEGYFRREWRLAVERAGDMAEEKAFLVPVVIDDTSERHASVPDKFRDVQWTHLAAGEAQAAFIERVSGLLSSDQASTQPRTTPAARGTPSKSQDSKRKGGLFWWWRRGVLLAAVVVAVGYLVADKVWLAKRSTAPAQTLPTTDVGAQSGIAEKSIAVLPFVDLSEKHDQEYFADGMAEEILDILAKIPQLTVIGRTSSFQFKNRTEDLRIIGERLRSAYVVEGSVRKAGDRMRVTAQLIDSRSGTHLWSESYDRDFGDVLNLEDEIATSIARALQVTIVARDPHPLQNARAIEAYTLYLKGKRAGDKFEATSLLEAQNSFQQALALDRTLLPAAEGLASTYLNRGSDESDITAREAWNLARGAAETALQLNPGSATAHNVLGFVAGMGDYDWSTAESEFRKALALNPNDPDALANAGQISAMHGDYEIALQRLNAALAIDPLNAIAYFVLGETLYLKGDYSGAEAALRRAISIDPHIDGCHYYIGLMEVVQGRSKEALKEFAADPDVATRDGGLALASHALGRKAESDAALARLIGESGKTWPYGVARVYAYRGETNPAFDWLNLAYAGRDVDLMDVLREPLLMPLHNDPRWAALMRKMHLAE